VSDELRSGINTKIAKAFPATSSNVETIPAAMLVKPSDQDLGQPFGRMTGAPGMENVNTSCQRHDRGTTDRHLGHLRYVRHSLYLAEAIGSNGAVTQFLAEWAALLLAVQIPFQLRRMLQS
jgi:hypothetical protein